MGEGCSILQVWTDPGLAAVATFFKMLPESPPSPIHPDLVPHPNYSHALLSSILGVPGFARPSIPYPLRHDLREIQNEPWSTEGRHPEQ